MLFLENWDSRSGQMLSRSNVLGIAPYPLVAFLYDLTSMANGIDAGSGSGEQPILWSSPLMGVPEAAVVCVAQTLGDVDDSICDQYEDRNYPCMLLRTGEMHGCQNPADVMA